MNESRGASPPLASMNRSDRSRWPTSRPGRDRDSAAARDQPRHVADPPDVGVTVCFGEAQAFGKVRTDLVAVEHLGMPCAPGELGRQGVGDGRLAGPGEPCEPDHEAAAHDLLPSRPHRRLTRRSRPPNIESMAIPITKITIMIASSCCASLRFLADWSC